MEDTDQDVQGLTSLPTEVLSQILMYVDGSDIPALQQKTCQTLHSVTMARQFWYDRIRRLCEEHVVSPPEEELEEYSIAELEQWTMRRISARNSSPVKLQLRSRDSPKINFYGSTFLIPGGRWLLKFHNLRVYFIDLDSSNLEPRLLVDHRNDDLCISNYRGGGSRIWIDHKAPRLKFRFQGSLVDLGGEPFTWVYIYQVDLIGRGPSATLVAQIIATFRCPRASKLRFSHTLNDHYFVQVRGVRSFPGPGVEIFDYRKALGCFDYPLMKGHALFLSEGYSTYLEFINEDFLAIYYNATTTCHVFNLETPTSFKLLHKIELPERSCGFSRTCWTSKASLVTFFSPPNFATIQEIYGLVIPHDNKFHPWTVQLSNGFLGNRNGDITFKSGIFVSLLCNYKTDTLSRLSHEWDYTCQSPGNGSTRTSNLEQDVDQLGALVAFDEDTGRSVYFSEGELKVLDIVIAG